MELITTHLNADFDGLASMVAARKLYPGAVPVFSGGAQEAVRSFLAIHDLGLARLKDINPEEVSRLILVDTQDPDRIGPLKSLCEKPQVAIHVYDHHLEREQAEEGLPPSRVERRVVEPVGATTTVLIERLQADRVPVAPFEATVLALGLYEETGFMTFASTTPRDLHAAAFLLGAGADLNMVSDALRQHLDPDQIALLNDLLESAETFYVEGRKVLLVASTSDRYRGDLAGAVHRLAEVEGVDAVLAALAMEDKVAVIARSRRPEIDIGALLREFGGGGHPEAASASVKGQTVVEVRERLAQILTERFRPTLLARDVMTSPVKTLNLEATIAEAERYLTVQGVNVLPVLDAKLRYQGVISRENVQKALFHGFAESPVQTFLQTDQYTAAPETPFREIEARMIERNQRFVPILEADRVVGVVTRTDLLRTLHDDVLGAARARAKGEEPPVRPSRRNVRGLLKERLPARIYQVLRQAGELGDELGVPVYVVGGFVRDLLLGIENLDVDLVVEGDGIAFARALARPRSARVKAHERFGTAVVIFPEGFKLDVATARTEYYEYPTALPTVERSSIKKDLYRRDFTINTLAIRLNASQFGGLIDFYGGQRDLNEKTIRVLHSLSFVEDPTRVFRAIRFEQRFGFRLGKETLALIKGAVKMDLFHRLSGHRLLEELVLLFSDQEPRKAILRLAELDLLRFIHPSFKASLTRSPRFAACFKAVEAVLDWYRLLYLDRKVEVWVVYFMALMDLVPSKAVGETMRRLAVPARQAGMIKAARRKASALLKRVSARTNHRPSATYRALEGLPDETLLFLMAKCKSEAVKRELSAYVTQYRTVKPLLTGEALKAMGIKPGPIYRKVLERLRDARLNGEVKSEDEERELARRIAKM